MIDSPFYAQKYLKKMQLFLENGIIPDLNLITTFETKDNPLTSQKVQEQINIYFSWCLSKAVPLDPSLSLSQENVHFNFILTSL